MKKYLLASVALIALSACSGGNSTTVVPPTTITVTPPAPVVQPPVPQPAPTPTPAPVEVVEPTPPVVNTTANNTTSNTNNLLFAADWTGPNISCGLTITGDCPPIVKLPNNYIWGTFNTANGACIDPGPNSFFDTKDGKLNLHAGNIGFPIIHRDTISSANGKLISIQSEMTCVSCDPSGWGGLVLYNGDSVIGTPDLSTGNWRSIYFSRSGQKLVLGMWGPTYLQIFDMPDVQLNVPYKLRIDYIDGTLTYYVNDILMLVESPDHPLSKDNVHMLNDPHLAIFLGNMNLTVGLTQIYGELGIPGPTQYVPKFTMP